MESTDQPVGVRRAAPSVLIVEDEMLIAMELEHLLSTHGYRVLGPVNTVARALTLLEQQQPDAALLDVNLNGESSTPVAAELWARDVPFVTVTAYSSVAARHPQLRDAPRADKPIDHDEVLRLLVTVLGDDAGHA